MTIKELLLQEINNSPKELLEDLLSFLHSLKTTPKWEHLKFVRTDELADRGENQRK